VGSLKFYEREEVKDALALLALLINPRDEISFRRVANKPSRGLGAASIDRIVEEAYFPADYADIDNPDDSVRGDILAAGARLMGGLSPKAKSGLAVFLTALENSRSLLILDADTAFQDDSLRRVHTPAPWGGTKGMYPESDTLREQPYPVRFAAGLVDSTDAALPDAGQNPSSPAENSGPAPKAGASRTQGVKDKKKAAPGRKKSSTGGKGDLLKAEEGLSVCVVRLVLDSGIADYHNSREDASGNQRIGNLQELANAASLYPATQAGLLEFLEHIELDRSLEDAAGKDKSKEDAVTLITLHNTKGLEYRRVVMTGVEQGIFPREDKKDEDLEEERRLFYVGATRAMDELYLVSCAMRRMFGSTIPMSPSVFLREIDASALRVIGAAPFGFSSSKNAAIKLDPVGTANTTHTAKPAGSGAKFGRNASEFSRAAGLKTPGPAKVKASADGRWRVGDRLFHDDHGYGAVIGLQETEDGSIVKAQFDTGHETRFLSQSQSSRFLKIKDE
jgi:DNA helicase-2/ATP-dependent DNA helicase PcrA